MKKAARAVGWLAILGGVLALAVPGAALAIGRSMATSGGLYVIAVLRVVIGVVLIEAARGSRMPRTLRVFGVIAILAGLATPVLGVAGARAILDGWFAERPTLVRLIGAGASAIGGVILRASRQSA